MDYDEEILMAFKEAAKKGRKEISTEAILFLTDVPEDAISTKLQKLEKYGLVKSTIPSKKPRFLWKLND